MRKKFISLALAAVVLVSVLGGCGKQTEGNKGADTAVLPPAAADNFGKELNYDVLFIISKNRVPDKPSLMDKELKERFNMTVKWQEIPSSGVNEKVNLLFASGEEPDLVWPVGVTEAIAKKLGGDGFLAPLNKHMDQMSNYRKLFTDEEWKTMQQFARNADGNVYYLPQRNYRTAATAWIYRKSAFDAMDLKFPKTVEELYTALRAIKAKYPDSSPITRSMMEGLTKSYGIGGLTSDTYQKGAYVDPFTNEFVAYGFTGDKMREVLKIANKFYKEGLVDKEFANMPDQSWTERYANGKVFIEYSWATRVAWADENMKKADPNAKWEWSRENISAYPDKGFVYDRELPHIASGPMFSKKITDEKMNRMIKFFDWLSTEEGSLFVTMGKEGVTFEKKDGETIFMPHMYHSVRNPKGENEWKYGLYLPFIVQHPAYIKESGKILDLEVSDAYVNNKNAKYFKPIAWAFTSEEEKQIADLSTIVQDIYDENSIKFIMGQLDPNNDTAWENYKKAMDKAGLAKLVQLRTDAYKRIK